MQMEILCPSCGQKVGFGIGNLFQRQFQCTSCGYAAPVQEFMKSSAEKYPEQAPLPGLVPAPTTNWNDAVAKPVSTQVQIENMPGYRFYARVPAGSKRYRIFGLALFTVIWCGFMVMWNAIAITQREWGMLAFGVIHDAVGLALLSFVLWRIFGSEEMTIESGMVRVTRRFLGIPFLSSWPVTDVEGVRIEAVRQKNGPPTPALKIVVAGKAKGFAGGANLEDLSWLRTEMESFLSGQWRG